MSAKIPAQNNPETREGAPDNARKFIVEDIDPKLLADGDVTQFTLTTNWLETDEDTETKVALKEFTDRPSELLLIAKVTVDGNRTATKKPIEREEYDELVKSSIVRVEKQRHEFTLTQAGKKFVVKYDEFVGSDLRIIEVDAEDEATRASFDPTSLPGKPVEVPASDRSYEGYRVADHL